MYFKQTCLTHCGAFSGRILLKTPNPAIRSRRLRAACTRELNVFRPLKIGLVVECDSWYESSRIKSFNVSCCTGSERQAHHMIEAVEAVKIFDVEAPKRIAAGRGRRLCAAIPRPAAILLCVDPLSRARCVHTRCPPSHDRGGRGRQDLRCRSSKKNRCRPRYGRAKASASCRCLLRLHCHGFEHCHVRSVPPDTPFTVSLRPPVCNSCTGRALGHRYGLYRIYR